MLLVVCFLKMGFWVILTGQYSDPAEEEGS